MRNRSVVNSRRLLPNFVFDTYAAVLAFIFSFSFFFFCFCRLFRQLGRLSQLSDGFKFFFRVCTGRQVRWSPVAGSAEAIKDVYRRVTDGR